MFRLFKQKLVFQLGIAVTLISFGAVTLMGLVTYRAARDTIQDNALSQVAHIATGIDVILEHWVAEQKKDFKVLLSNDEFYRHAIDVLEGRRSGRDGHNPYQYLREFTGRRIVDTTDFMEILVLSKRGGRVLFSTRLAEEGSYQRDSTFFQSGLEGEALTPVYTSTQTLAPVMTLSAPAVNASGETVGVVAVHLDLKGVLEHIRDFPTIAQTGIAYLVDRHHVPVSAPAEVQKAFPRGLHSEGITAALKGELGVSIYTDFIGQQVVGSYRWLDTFGLALMTEVPLVEAFEPARQLGWGIFAIGCGGVLLISSGMIVLARRIVRPVLEVSRAARQVAAGDLDVEPLGPARAEIGVLVSSFNEMVRQIHGLVDDVRDREERYRTVFNASGEAIFIHDGDSSRVLDYNDTAKRIFRLADGEQIKDVEELSAGYPPYASEDAMEKIIAARDEGPQTFEWRSRRKGGELFWSEVSLTKMFVGGELRFLAVVRDIEQRKSTEAELAEYRQNLEWAIEDRTRQLEDAQSALVKQERLAVLGQLTATVSHELRNPLGTISNALFALDAALNSGVLESARKSLEMIDRNVRRCDKIIGELLDFTRSHESEMHTVELDQWLAAVLDEYRFPAEIELRRDLAKNVRVFIDRESMRRALVNLLDNAVQAMQEAKARGHCLSVETQLAGGYAEIRITDEGPGIPEEHRKAIFEPLFSTKEFGVGLGVPIIQNVVKKHGGEINYYCPPNGGTVAVITLPLAEKEENEES